MMSDCFVEPKQQIPILLTLPIPTDFALLLLFSLTRLPLVFMPFILSLLCGLHLGASCVEQVLMIHIDQYGHCKPHILTLSPHV